MCHEYILNMPDTEQKPVENVVGGGDEVGGNEGGGGMNGGRRRSRKQRRSSGSKRKGNAWTDLVKRVFNENKHKSGYKFKHALMDAKKLYKGAVVEPNRVGPTAAKTVATSIAKNVGKFADRALGTRRQRGGKSRRR